MVLGTHIVLNCSVLDSILRCTCSGFSELPKNSWPESLEVSFDDVKKSLSNSTSVPAQIGPSNIFFEARVFGPYGCYYCCTSAFGSMGYVLSNDSWVLKDVYEASQPGPSTKVKKSDTSAISSECYAELLAKLSSMDDKIESIKDLMASTLFQIEKIRDTIKEAVPILDKWLHRKKRAISPGQISTPALDWQKRLKIATAAAQGLCCMHHDCTRTIIHRDIKSSNILLDSEFNAKIADFGLAKILARRDDNPETASAIAGTFGYIAPELTTGREPILREDQMNLAQWAQKCHREGNSEALDEEVMETSNLEQMRGVFKLVLMCTGASPSGRPSMKEVCNILQSFRDPIF
ncbi:L-type lectin-domain containing receptor kinase V.4-like [Lycium ferocissimum]|uniref:L-type lectin-domain containing receptor kinase V.4-like n=1 Tax=Lycium ferocissimum TaxID=112874 RepID=UPI0028165B7B|nr:L-type lectin-domain containing receptor kinase V.4-like [Lycium ferocissimum]